MHSFDHHGGMNSIASKSPATALFVLADIEENDNKITAKGHLDDLQKADIVSTSKMVPSVFIKTHYWIDHR